MQYTNGNKGLCIILIGNIWIFKDQMGICAYEKMVTMIRQSMDNKC